MKNTTMTILKTFKLKDLGQIVGGGTPSTLNQSYFCGTIPWLTPKDLSNFTGRFISHGERYLSTEGVKSCATKILPKNSILFSSRAPIGYIAISSNDICTSQDFNGIIPNKNAHYLYLFYLLKHNKNYIKSFGVGTTIKGVSVSVFRDIEVIIHLNIEEQKVIASILSSLDEKIDLLHRQNQTLEAMTKAIFKQWFLAEAGCFDGRN